VIGNKKENKSNNKKYKKNEMDNTGVKIIIINIKGIN
jgi:hypothetical protein